MRDDLPPPQDGGVTEEAHRRAAVEATLEPPPQLADGVELIGEYEGSGFKEPPYIARRADGQVVQMAKLLYLVAEEIDGRRGYDEIAKRVTERFGRGLDGEMVKQLVDEKLRGLGVVALANGAEPELKKIDPLLALKFRAAVVPEGLVNAITKIFKPLFLPPVVIVVLGGLVGLDVWLFGYHGIAQSVRATLYDPLFILLMLGLVALSAAFHECGHASATAYGGARPGVMGVGLYIVWPAFYTDITDAYRLGKGGRLRADLGGVYFNTIFILATAGAYFATGFEPLLLIIPLQHLEILHQFLPFLRLDGYYIVSDLTGVPDMFMRIKPTLKSLIPWRETDESVKELKLGARVAVTAYVLVLVPLLGGLLALTVMNLPRIFATAYDSFMVTEHKLVHAPSIISAIVDGIQLAVLVLMPLGIVVTFARFGQRMATGVWRKTEDRPAARAFVVLAATAAAAFAAYTWIPASVYRPIQPGERGTFGSAVGQFDAIPSGRPALSSQQLTHLRGAPFRSRSNTTTPTKPTQITTTHTVTGSTSQTFTTQTTTTPVVGVAPSGSYGTVPTDTTYTDTTYTDTTYTDTTYTDTTYTDTTYTDTTYTDTTYYGP